MKIRGPHCAFARTPMLTAASSAPSGVCAKPAAMPPLVPDGPACAETGSSTP